ncbi:MAG: FecR domain-containing protein [Candidatus Omnitrophica bacterium]|nr:FecR domain-containing protein [Candidatus Omnitrophota bacterium]
MRILRILCLSFMSLCFFTSLASATPPTPIGTLTYSEGVVDVAPQGLDAAFAKTQQPIYADDRIRTKRYSKAEITFIDKSVVKLAPETCVTIVEFRMKDVKKREFCRIMLSRGKVEAVVAKTGAPETFVIDTPNARGAVKGSDIVMMYQAGHTACFVREGALALLNTAAPDVKLQVAKGDCSFVSFKDAPQQIRPFLDAEMKLHLKDVNKSLIKKWIPSEGAALMQARVVSVLGTVRIFKKTASDWQQMQVGVLIQEGDTVQTGSDGRLEIALPNGNSLLLKADTELKCATMRVDSTNENFENTFEMKRGRVMGLVVKINKQSTFQVKTPTAIAGVRGSLFEVAAQPTGSFAPTGDPIVDTQVFFESGNGFVTSAINGVTQDLNAGENASVDPLGTVSPAIATDPQQRTEMTQVMVEMQSAGAYTSPEGQTILTGGINQQLTNEPLPPGIGPGGEPLDGKPLDFIDGITLPDKLTFDQVNKDVVPPPLPPPPPQPFYTVTMSLIPPPVGTTGGNMELELRPDYHWSASISGGISATTASSFTLPFENGVDQAHLLINGFMDTNSGSVNILAIDGAYNSVDGRTLVLNPSPVTMQYSGGTFTAAVGGTWTGAPPP